SDATRVLLYDEAGALELFDRQTKQQTMIAPPRSTSDQKLAPTAVVFLLESMFPWKLCEWQSNQISCDDRGAIQFVSAGNFALFDVNTNPNQVGPDYLLVLRDLSTGQSTTVSEAGQLGDVTPEGDVVYSALDAAGNRQIYHWKAGTTTQLTSDAGDHVLPRTDGTNTVYLQSDNVVLDDGTMEILLDPPNPLGHDYRVRAGWIAYTSPSGGAL